MDGRSFQRRDRRLTSNGKLHLRASGVIGWGVPDRPAYRRLPWHQGVKEASSAFREVVSRVG